MVFQATSQLRPLTPHGSAAAVTRLGSADYTAGFGHIAFVSSVGGRGRRRRRWRRGGRDQGRDREAVKTSCARFTKGPRNANGNLATLGRYGKKSKSENFLEILSTPCIPQPPHSAPKRASRRSGGANPSPNFASFERPLSASLYFLRIPYSHERAPSVLHVAAWADSAAARPSGVVTMPPIAGYTAWCTIEATKRDHCGALHLRMSPAQARPPSAAPTCL